MIVDYVSLITYVFLTNKQTEKNYRINTTNEDYTLQIKMITHDNCTFSTSYQKNSKEKKEKFQQYIWLPVQIFSCYFEILWKPSMIKFTFTQTASFN